LTAAGRKVIACAFAGHEEALDRAAGGLTAAERKRAAQLLRKLGITAQSLLPCAHKNRALSSNE
jgi:DNA-binding MarR family transcriptional regulator